MQLPPNQRKGKLGEDLAASYLTKRGYLIIERNFHSRYGEIDLIATKDSCTVFVEVKTRVSTSFGSPKEAVDSRKIEKIAKTAYYFLSLHPKLPEAMRIDVIAIMIDKLTQKESLEHIVNVTS